MYVNLLLNEIQLKPQLLKFTGCDDDDNLLTFIHCFMISSLMSKQKDVVKLVPAKTMKASRLLTFLKSVLHSFSQVGYAVVSIINNGNRINKKLFCLLFCCDNVFNLPSFNEKTFDITQKIFMLFDSVHILKEVRNN